MKHRIQMADAPERSVNRQRVPHIDRKSCAPGWAGRVAVHDRSVHTDHFNATMHEFLDESPANEPARARHQNS
jgi:hypothetical protein